MVDTRCAPEQDISGSHDGPKADRRVTRYFVALRSHARLRFLGDTALLLAFREKETEGHSLCTHANTHADEHKTGASRLALESRNVQALRFRAARCRIIISIIPDPNYDGINSRPESESTRRDEGTWTEEKRGRPRGRVGWRSAVH